MKNLVSAFIRNYRNEKGKAAKECRESGCGREQWHIDARQEGFSAGSRMPAYNSVEGADRDFVVSEAVSIGIGPNHLRFNSSGVKGTSYDPTDDVIDIKGDIFPRLTEAHPRARMSVRAVLAHEFYGHRPNRAQYFWELENSMPFDSDE